MSIVSRFSAVFASSVAAIVWLACATNAAQANQISTLTFSGAAWSNGSDSSGSITYEYDTSDNLTQIDSADISITAGTNMPAFTLIYDVPGMTNTASAPGWDYNHPSNLNYEFTFADSATGKINVYLDMAGIGPTAALARSVSGGNYTSLADYNVTNSVFTLSNAGTSSDVQVPEAPCAGILLAGAFGVVLLRRATPALGRKLST